jgi:hypothetical protein
LFSGDKLSSVAMFELIAFLSRERFGHHVVPPKMPSAEGVG